MKTLVINTYFEGWPVIDDEGDYPTPEDCDFIPLRVYYLSILPAFRLRKSIVGEVKMEGFRFN